MFNLNQCGPRTKNYEIFRAKCELVKCGIKSYFSDFFIEIHVSNKPQLQQNLKC